VRSLLPIDYVPLWFYSVAPQIDEGQELPIFTTSIPFLHNMRGNHKVKHQQYSCHIWGSSVRFMW